MEQIAQLGIKVDSSGIKQATTELSKLTNQSGKTESSIMSLRNVFASIGAGALAKQFVDTSDKLNLLDARLKLATSSVSEFKTQQEKLLQISLQSYTAYEDTVTLFTKLNPALKQVGASTEQVNNVVSTFTKGLQLGGSSANEASSAILQFAQAMGSGVLRGEEFNAIAEASPKLMSYLAKGLGVAQSELRKMAENGELTAGRVSNALLKVKSNIDRDFATLPVTVGKAMTNLVTATSLMIQDIDSATGATQSLSTMIQEFTGNIDEYSQDIVRFFQDVTKYAKENEKTLTQLEGVIVGVATAYLTFIAGGSVVAGIGAITNAIVALRISMLSLQASVPVLGWISAAVGISAATYIANMDDITEATNRNIQSIDDAQKALEDLAVKRKAISDDKFMLDSEQKAQTDAIDKQTLSIREQILALQEMKFERVNVQSSIIPSGDTSFIDKFKINTNEELKKELEIKRNEADVIKILGTEYQKFNLILDENTKKAKEKGATEKEINDFRTKEIKEFNEKQQQESKKTADEQKRLEEEQKKRLEELSTAYIDMTSNTLSQYDSTLVSIAEKTQKWIEAGVKENDVLAVQKQLIDELNIQQALSSASDELSFLERKAQLMTDEYEKSKLLLEIKYAQSMIDIQSSDAPLEEKQMMIEKETELYNLTKERIELDRNTEFQETISGFYDDMLESQLELNSALYDFGDGFGEVGNKIAAVSKSLASMTNADLKSKKEIAKLNDKYAKEFKKYSKDETKTKELVIAYEEEEQQLKKQTLMNQIGGLSEFAGQSKQFFGEQTGAYKALQAIEAVGHAARMAAMAAELPRQIESLYTNIANALASQGQIPIVGFALVAGMAALLAGLGVMSAGGGGGGASSGGGSKKPSQFDIREQELEDLYTPMTDRLDRQIELLESIDKQGSASALGLVGAKISFEKDYALAVNKINKTLPTDVKGYSYDFNNALSRIEAALGFNIADVIKIQKPGWDDSEARIYTDFGSLNRGNNMIKLISAYFEDTSKNGAIATLFGGRNALNLAANEIQETIGDFTSGIVDSLDDLKDASSDFKEHYDTITGSMYYENKKLADAFSDVQALTKGNPFAEYLKQNIDEIDTLSNTFSDSVVNTLLSQDPKDMEKQIKVLKDLQTQTGLVFQGGAKDALDFLESIELVAQAMATSATNTREFIDSFKSETQLAEDFASSMGLNLATTWNGLALKFKELSSDLLGLTDKDLEFLEKNKTYLESIAELEEENRQKELEDEKELAQTRLDNTKKELDLVKSSISKIESITSNLKSTIEKLRDSADSTSKYTLNKFYESMAKTQELLKSNDYEAITKSIQETIGYSSALSDSKNFTLSRDMQYAQLVAANQFEAMDTTLKDERDLLQKIADNTQQTVDKLSESIKSASTSQTVVVVPTNETTAIKNNPSSFLNLLPKFDVGTTRVPNDMFAQIHKDEIITPRNFSNGLRNGDLLMGETSSIISAINSMNANVSTRVSNLEAGLNGIISNQSSQIKIMNDTYDVNNGTLVSLQTIEKVI